MPEKTKQSSSQGPFCLWQGLQISNFIKLLRQKPQLHWSRFPRLATALSMSCMNTVLNQCERMVYSRRIAETHPEHPPLFILGHWRSGTTLLHNLIGCDPQFTYPNLYQVLFPGHFLLTESVVARLTAGLMPNKRPMDNMPCGWELPQEDEPALCLMTLLSPYMVLAFQHDRSRYDDYFDLKNLPEEMREQWRQAFYHLMKKITLRSNKPIVYKSPTHSFRIPMLLEMFPNARFVYIYRDPYVVYQSTLHLRQVMCAANGLARTNLDGMEEFVLEGYRSLFETYTRDRVLIPPGQLHEIRFEDFEADPVGELGELYEALNLDGFDVLRARVEDQLEELRNYKKNEYPMDTRLRRMIYECWKPAFDFYGYPSRLPEFETDAA